MTRIVVHIGELVLSGFRAEDRHAIANGLREQLAWELRDGGALQNLVAHGDVARLDGGTIPVPQGTAPAAIGGGAARCIASAPGGKR